MRREGIGCDMEGEWCCGGAAACGAGKRTVKSLTNEEGKRPLVFTTERKIWNLNVPCAPARVCMFSGGVWAQEEGFVLGGMGQAWWRTLHIRCVGLARGGPSVQVEGKRKHAGLKELREVGDPVVCTGVMAAGGGNCVCP